MRRSNQLRQDSLICGQQRCQAPRRHCCNRHWSSSSVMKSTCPLLLAVLSVHLSGVTAWGGSSTSNNYGDTTKYGMSFGRDWLYNSKTIAIKYEGCVWGYVDDREEMGCMEDESGDGTTMWYMMANCRRAQVAYSVYASDSGTTSCSSSDFKESLVTKSGVAEFVYYVNSYSSSSPFSDYDTDELPICEQNNDSGYYMGVGCSSSGGFTLDLYADKYCLQYVSTYASLDDLNSGMSSLNSCLNCYDSSKGQDSSSSLCAYLASDSESCSSEDSPICQSNSFVSSAGFSSRKSSGGSQSSSIISSEDSSLSNKLKYGIGSALLCCSAALFVGILFTNRRKRRAMMQRKYRHSAEKRRAQSRSRKKDYSNRSSRSNRSSSRKRRSDSKEDERGVYA